MSEADTKLSANEYLKTDSNYLRGTILEGLADQLTGAISESDQQLTKFHGIYMQDDRDLRKERRLQKLERAYSFMIRVRVPGGVCTPEQWIQMDDIADKYTVGTIKLTTRQAFQFHGILKGVLKKTMQEINKSLLDTIAACGDVNRNVMCSVNPDESPVHAQVLDISQKISDHLTPQTKAYHEIWLDGEKVESSEEEVEPIYGKTYLPRKFKAGVTVPPYNDVDIYSQDLGFIAIVEDGKLLGYNLSVGGGFGTTHGNTNTFPRLADVVAFVLPEQVVQVSEEVVKIQRDFGDRTDRKHARFKYTMEDRGVEWFKKELFSRLGYELPEPKEFTFTRNGDRYGWHQLENGNWSYTFFITNGRVKDTKEFPMKTGLRELAKVHTGDIRLTANQNVMFSGITPELKDRFQAMLEEFGFSDPTKLSGLRRNSMACVALPTCTLALSESERFLPDLVTELEDVFEEVGLRDDEVIIRMTGCPNGCARPFLGEIGFIGKAPGVYNLYLGAGFKGDRLNKLYRESIKQEDIVPTLRPIIEDYAKTRNEGEKFGDFVIRKEYVKATLRGSEFHD